MLEWGGLGYGGFWGMGYWGMGYGGVAGMDEWGVDSPEFDFASFLSLTRERFNVSPRLPVQSYPNSLDAL